MSSLLRETSVRRHDGVPLWIPDGSPKRIKAVWI